MHLTDIKRVVDFETLDKAFCLDINLAANYANSCSCPQLYIVAGSRHTHHTSKHAVTELMHVEVVPNLPLLDYLLILELVLVLRHDGHQETRAGSRYDCIHHNLIWTFIIL